MGQGLFHGRCFCTDGVFDALIVILSGAEAQSFCGTPTGAVFPAIAPIAGFCERPQLVVRSNACRSPRASLRRPKPA